MAYAGTGRWRPLLFTIWFLWNATIETLPSGDLVDCFLVRKRTRLRRLGGVQQDAPMVMGR